MSIPKVDEATLRNLLASFDLAKIPDDLPCRDKEIRHIRSFIETNLNAGTSGCIFISGVPGTGKTASVRLVKRQLENGKRHLPRFIFVELNGMLVSDPKRIFVEFYNALEKRNFFGQKKTRGATRVSPNAAKKILCRIFDFADRKRPAIVLLLDEIDGLVTKRQEHLYQIFDWSNQDSAKMTVLAIANTLDFPERALSNRNHSRMGMHRLRFSAYDHCQIQNILHSRLQKAPDAVLPDAAAYMSRKVASVSGDIRRAFETCRMAIELALSRLDTIGPIASTLTRKRKAQEQRLCNPISIDDANAVLKKMSMNVKVQAIKHASKHEQFFLRAVVLETRRIGSEGIIFSKIWSHYQRLCDEQEIPMEPLCIDELFDIGNRLAECRLVIKVTSVREGKQDFTCRYRLNVHAGDVELALTP